MSGLSFACAPSTGTTVVWVLATADALIVGIRADDPEPSRITSFARERDASLLNEDHIRLVLDTYLDGGARRGWHFASNLLLMKVQYAVRY